MFLKNIIRLFITSYQFLPFLTVYDFLLVLGESRSYGGFSFPTMKLVSKPTYMLWNKTGLKHGAEYWITTVLAI